MNGHNLMQAIARVNRVFKGKAGGLVVDYIGIAKALKQAMRDYTKRDREQFGNPNIKETALLKFQEKLEVCRSLMHGYDYSAFKDCTALTEVYYTGSEQEWAMIYMGSNNDCLKNATIHFNYVPEA